MPTLLRSFTDPIRLDSARDQVPRTYIWCTEDQEGLAGSRRSCARSPSAPGAIPRWRFHQLNAIPDAYIQMPDTVADLFDEAARQ